MTKALRISLFAVGGFVSLLVLAALALLLFVDADTFKPQLEAAASKAMGLEVKVGGRLGIGFFPGLHFKLEELQIHNRGDDLLFAKEAKLGVDLLPLLRTRVRIGTIALKHPRISIKRDLAGRFNFQNPARAGRTLLARNLATISVEDGTFHYADQKSGNAFTAKDCRLGVQRLRFSGGKSRDLMKNLSLTAKLTCGEVQARDFAVSDLKFSVTGKNGAFELSPLSMHLFGGRGSGKLQAEFGNAAPLYHIDYTLAQFHLEEFLKNLSPDQVAEGALDFSAKLSIQGKTTTELKRSTEGMVSLQGKNLRLHSVDLDQRIANFESSQNFNLVDVGALFFAGPLGLVVTKGYNFASIFQGAGGQSEIHRLVSTWKVERGVAQAQDVAMATDENRLALQGGLDFVNQRFDEVVVAVIDAEGCATVRQKIHGTFQKPLLEKPGIIRSLTGPAVNLMKKGIDLLPGGGCEGFYSGSVAPPK